MNNCWQILQISPTSDTKTIRKAYAKLLKTTRPDDDAAAYQALREAFDEALRIAPYQNDTPPDNPPETDFRQPETAQTASNPECVAWIARVQNIIAQDGIVGVLRERQSLSEQIWETTSYDQRDEAALFWLNFLREQSYYSPWLWNFGASWFGWWDEEQQLLTEAEFNRLHAKQDDADYVLSPANLWQHLQELDKNGSDLWAFWQQFPYEIQSFTDDENRKLGILLNAWRERDDLPENLRQEWQTRYPEFSGSLKSDEIAEIDDKLAHLRALFAENGVVGVWAVHAETEKWLDNLPPLAQPLVAKQLLDLLREWQTRSPHLWSAWGLRFGWRDNVWLNTELSDDEIEHFYYQKHLTDFYHNISELADFLNHAYQNMGDGQTEIGYLWAAYQADIFMLSETELAQLHALMTHYLQYFPHRLNETVFNDWYARTQGETAFRQPETLENAENNAKNVVPQYDFSGSTELIPQDVRAYVDKLFVQHNRQSHHLIDKWDEIRALIQKLPLGNDEQVSYLLLDFLRENQVYTPRIWAQWGKHFGWHNDYRMAQMLSHEELELLQKYINIAEFQSPNFRQPETLTRYPISYGLRDLVHKGKRAKAMCAAMILYHEWEREIPSEQRKNTFGVSDLGKIDQRSENLRMVYFALLITATLVTFLAQQHLFVDGSSLWVMWTFAVLISCRIYLFLATELHKLMPNFAPKFSAFQSSILGQIILGMALPIAMMAGAMSFSLSTWNTIFWFAFAGTIWTWYLNMHRITHFAFSRWWFVQIVLLGGFVFTIDDFASPSDTPSQFWGMDVGMMGEFYFAVWAMILWFNTSVLLKEICDQRGWLKNPVAQTVLFLPAVVLQYSNRVSGSQIWEWLCWQTLTLGAMMWVLPYPHAWLAFYPVLLVLIALAHTLKYWAKRQIDV